jgi:hypothetical protein
MRQYKVSVCKMTERDMFETGCIPETQMDLGQVYTFKGSDLKMVFDRIIQNTSLELQDIQGAELFELRLECSVLETEDGYRANTNQINQWKVNSNRMPLYNSSYSIYLSVVEETEVNAGILKGVLK